MCPLYRIQKKGIFVGLGCYATVVLLMTVIPSALSLQVSYFNYSGASCWLVPGDSSAAAIWDHIDNAVDCIVLAVPIIPTGISCVISIYKMVYFDEGVVNETCSNLKKRATVTIIIFTAVYFIFNIPLFIIYIFWTITSAEYDAYPGPYFEAELIYNYAWNFTRILCVGTNSAINPWIYFFRIRKFRRWVMGGVQGYYRQDTRTLEPVTGDSQLTSGELEGCVSCVVIPSRAAKVASDTVLCQVARDNGHVRQTSDHVTTSSSRATRSGSAGRVIVNKAAECAGKMGESVL